MTRHIRSRTKQAMTWVGVGLLAVMLGFGLGYLADGRGPDYAPQSTSAREPEKEPPSPTSTPTKRDQPRPKERLITNDVTVQILNGSGSEEADDRVLKRLLRLRYHVLVMNPARHDHAKTTVLWSKSASKDAATALAGHFGWRAKPAPRSLSDSVTTHVVVGADEA